MQKLSFGLAKVNYIFFMLLCTFFGYAQVSVLQADGSVNTIEKVVQRMVGQGIKISNITFSGKNLDMAGSFTDRKKSVGFSQGSILTNEKAKNAEAPNKARNTQNTVTENRTDADLNTIFGTTFQDVAKIEFDFVAATDSISINYQFASDEYNEFINTYTDGMAIMLSGPGIAGKKNIAKLQNGTTISVNNIHAGISSPLDPDATNYWQNPKADFCNNCEYFVFNPALANTTEYDGYTTVLVAKEKILPCQTYHLKIVIGDANDSNIDSGIFIESKNIKSTYIYSSKKPEIDTIAICQNDIRPIISITSPMLNYQWFHNQTFTGNSTPKITTSLAGWYAISTTVPQGCVFRDSLYLKLANEFTLGVTNDTLACNFSPISLTSTINIPDTYSYKWLPNNQTTSKITAPTVSQSTQTYTVTATNIGGCTKNAYATVSISPNFYTINPTSSEVKVCLQNTITLSSGLASTDPFTIPTTLPSGIIYQWNSNQSYPNQSQIEWNTTLVGTNVVTITALTPEGCKLKNTLTITGSKQPIIIKTSKDSLCIGNSVTINSTTTGAFKRIWSYNNFTTLGFSLTPTGSAFYVLTAFSNFHAPNCVAIDSVFIKVNQLPVYTKSADTAICVGEKVKIKVDAASSILQWIDSVNFINNSIIKPLKSVSYKFVLTTQQGCVSPNDVINITVNSLPFISLSNDTTVCEANKTTIYVKTFSGNFLWTYPIEIVNSTSVSKIIYPINSEIYSAKTINQFGCIAEDSITVFVNKNPKPPLLTASKLDYCEIYEDFVTLSAKPNYNYLWNTKAILQTVLVKNEGWFVLTVTDNNLCKSVDSIFISRNCEGIYKIPNVFTPNGDGNNEYFEIIGNENASSLIVYNRYGVEVYKSDNYKNDWAAKNQPDGIYFYYFKTSLKEFKGWIEILR